MMSAIKLPIYSERKTNSLVHLLFLNIVYCYIVKRVSTLGSCLKFFMKNNDIYV